jgi:hypothetical protein
MCAEAKMHPACMVIKDIFHPTRFYRVCRSPRIPQVVFILRSIRRPRHDKSGSLLSQQSKIHCSRKGCNFNRTVITKMNMWFLLDLSEQKALFSTSTRCLAVPVRQYQKFRASRERDRNNEKSYRCARQWNGKSSHVSRVAARLTMFQQHVCSFLIIKPQNGPSDLLCTSGSQSKEIRRSWSALTASL